MFSSSSMASLNIASQAPLPRSSSPNISLNSSITAGSSVYKGSLSWPRCRTGLWGHSLEAQPNLGRSYVPPAQAFALDSGPMATQAPDAAQRAAEADVMGLLLRQRIVFLGCALDDFAADAIISQLLLLDAQDPQKDIRLFINSSGGSMSAAMGVFDAIQLCRAPVSTIAFGFAASTAAIILASGSKGKRYAMPNSRIMLHQPMGGASGQAIDVEIQAKEIMYHKTNITQILSQITGRSYEQIEEDIDRDRYMSPLEAVEYGILDGVIDKDAIIPLVPVPEKVTRRPEIKDAEQDPMKFLIPVIPDDEIY